MPAAAQLPRNHLVVGTRTSRLARWQSEHVIALLQQFWPDLTCELRPFQTRGDRTLDRPLPEIGGKGLFTAELEYALGNGQIDIAVHSLKDLPVQNPPGLTIGAIPAREDVAHMEPAAAEGLRGCFRIVVVPLHHDVAAHHDLA